MNAAVRALIVDDHQIVREGLSLLLGDVPEVEVVGAAADAAEALALTEALQPDVVLMDLNLPGADGIEATDAIRTRFPQVNVLVLTTFGDDDLVRRAIQAGAIGYLLKDVLKDDLVQAILAAAAGRPALHPEIQRRLMRQAVAPSEPSPLASLTERERDVLRCLASGQSNRAIARSLGLTEGTVKGYVSALLSKLGVADRTQAALLAARHGLASG